MTELPREGNGHAAGIAGPELASRDGRPQARAVGPVRHCAYCGTEVGPGDAPERFGEGFCSEAHAEEFVKGVRGVRIQAVAVGAPETQRAGETVAQKPTVTTQRSDWKMALKMAACCAAPILALVVLAGGGGALLGAAGAILPLLLFLACPLAMLLMMRGMAKMHDKDKGGGDGK